MLPPDEFGMCLVCLEETETVRYDAPPLEICALCARLPRGTIVPLSHLVSLMERLADVRRLVERIVEHIGLPLED